MLETKAMLKSLPQGHVFDKAFVGAWGISRGRVCEPGGSLGLLLYREYKRTRLILWLLRPSAGSKFWASPSYRNRILGTWTKTSRWIFLGGINQKPAAHIGTLVICLTFPSDSQRWSSGTNDVWGKETSMSSLIIALLSPSLSFPLCLPFPPFNLYLHVPFYFSLSPFYLRPFVSLSAAPFASCRGWVTSSLKG